jgi:tetratricopeptide (TPR) repeat protein
MASPAYRAAIAPLLLALLAVTPLSSAEYPRHSRSRAEQQDAWRAQIRIAEEAVRQERQDEAESAFLDLIEQAANANDEGLLVARAVDGLGDLYRAQGRLPEAARLYERSASMWERLLGPRQPRLAVTYHNLGAVYLSMGDSQSAENRFVRALAIWEAVYGADSSQAGNSRRALRAAQELPPAD